MVIKAAPPLFQTRAIFVSTRFLEEGSLESLSQGRTTLMSHSMGEFKFGHLGYWGGERFRR